VCYYVFHFTACFWVVAFSPWGFLMHPYQAPLGIISRSCPGGFIVYMHMPSCLRGCVEIRSACHAYTSASGACTRGKERGGMKERGELRGQEAKQQYIG